MLSQDTQCPCPILLTALFVALSSKQGQNLLHQKYQLGPLHLVPYTDRQVFHLCLTLLSPTYLHWQHHWCDTVQEQQCETAVWCYAELCVLPNVLASAYMPPTDVLILFNMVFMGTPRSRSSATLVNPVGLFFVTHPQVLNFCFMAIMLSLVPYIYGDIFRCRALSVLLLRHSNKWKTYLTGLAGTLTFFSTITMTFLWPSHSWSIRVVVAPRFPTGQLFGSRVKNKPTVRLFLSFPFTEFCNTNTT